LHGGGSAELVVPRAGCDELHRPSRWPV